LIKKFFHKIWEFNLKPRFAKLLGFEDQNDYKRQFSLSNDQKKFIDSLAFFKHSTSSSKMSEEIILIQMLKDYEYTIKFAAASKVICEDKALVPKFYDPDWTSRIGWGKKRGKVSRFFFRPKLETIYSVFAGEKVFNAYDMFPNQVFIKEKLKDIKNKLVNPNDVLQITIDEIQIGDLIYDTYLRYFHKPTLENINTEILLLIEIALNIYFNFINLLEKYKIKIMLNIYTSYIDHGITSRICIKKGITVYTLGSYSYVIQEATRKFPYHQINHTKFEPSKMLSDKQLALAEEKLALRFKGFIDGATSYMRQTAFADLPLDNSLRLKFSQKARNIVIYVHEFYDSPHINRKLLFPDLYQFLKQTLNALVDLKNTNVFVKLHPNGMPGSREIAIEMVTHFNAEHFHILDEAVSNLHIIDLKPTLVATARGTVGVEMAYFGIPTVALFDNMYANFDFVHTCMNTESYFSILRGNELPKVNFNRKNINSFYYQAFLEKNVNDDNNILRTLSDFKGDTFSDKYLEYIFKQGYVVKQNQLLDNYANALKNFELS
jgi:hypothetical protein